MCVNHEKPICVQTVCQTSVTEFVLTHVFAHLRSVTFENPLLAHIAFSSVTEFVRTDITLLLICALSPVETHCSRTFAHCEVIKLQTTIAFSSVTKFGQTEFATLLLICALPPLETHARAFRKAPSTAKLTRFCAPTFPNFVIGSFDPFPAVRT